MPDSVEEEGVGAGVGGEEGGLPGLSAGELLLLLLLPSHSLRPAAHPRPQPAHNTITRQSALKQLLISHVMELFYYISF